MKAKHTSGILTINPVETAYESIGFMSELRPNVPLKRGFKFKEIARIGWSQETTNEERVANSERIVKTWNMHDKLVEALKELIPQVRKEALQQRQTYASMEVAEKEVDDLLLKYTSLISESEK